MNCSHIHALLPALVRRANSAATHRTPPMPPLPSMWPRLPRRACQRKVSSKRLVAPSQQSGEQRQHQSARVAHVRRRGHAYNPCRTLLHTLPSQTLLRHAICAHSSLPGPCLPDARMCRAQDAAVRRLDACALRLWMVPYGSGLTLSAFPLCLTVKHLGWTLPSKLWTARRLLKPCSRLLMSRGTMREVLRDTVACSQPSIAAVVAARFQSGPDGEEDRPRGAVTVPRSA